MITLQLVQPCQVIKDELDHPLRMLLTFTGAWRILTRARCHADQECDDD